MLRRLVATGAVGWIAALEVTVGTGRYTHAAVLLFAGAAVMVAGSVLLVWHVRRLDQRAERPEPAAPPDTVDDWLGDMRAEIADQLATRHAASELRAARLRAEYLAMHPEEADHR